MVSTRLVVAAVAGVVALALVGAAVLTGVGPAPGGGEGAGTETEPFPTAVPTDASETGTQTTGQSTAETGTSTAAGTATPIPQRPSFGFTIDRIEECGQTCRDVTSTLTNDGTANATGVTVHTRILIGNGTDGDTAWRGSEQVGSLPAGESHTATKRVELSYGEALAIQQEDGWITIQTTVVSDQRTVTFTDRRKVA